jgi:hypothetical protein
VGRLRTEVGEREFACVGYRYVVGDKNSTNSRRRPREEERFRVDFHQTA